jgi:transglutaminase-like putative cysteine protease
MDHFNSNSIRSAVMINSDHLAVKSFALKNIDGSTDDVQRAVRLYYAVRDGFRYDPYKVDLSIEGLKASRVLEDGFGWCIPKAVLLAAACRVVGIPARLGLADVQNHMSTARLREIMGTDIFYRHGYTAIFLNGRWLKATPAFNLELCQKMRLHPLAFDGKQDSIYHPYDLDGNRHMEYVSMQGEHDDVPREDLLNVFAMHYPHMKRLDQASWDDDVNAEVNN